MTKFRFQGDGSGPGKPRILLVDDEVSGAEVLGMILRQEGFEVMLAGNGRQALAQLAEARPDLLVSDFMMPVMDGAELLRSVRAMPHLRALPVLLMSGAPESALLSYRLDYQGFLRKPFGIEELLAAVLRLLRPPT